MVTAQRWLRTCSTDHRACNQPVGTQWHPTRLVDVGSYGNTPDVVRLVTKDTGSLSGSYVTLSHCWGEAEFLKLQKANVEILRSGFGLELLPKTFQDAIVVARRLKVPYVWIDSLCIMQDDENDWQAESLLMEKVYSSAYCNIAATASSDSSQGLFRRRDPALLHRIELQRASTDSGGYTKAQRFTAVDFNYWRRALYESPLLRRAWVVQERLLARRVLHYNDTEIVWECREQTASETYLLGPVTHIGVHLFKNLDPAVRFEQGLGVKDDSPLARWGGVAQHYSRCALTMRRDKLVALSGIAKKYQSLMNDAYVAGMWQKSLAAQLLWRNGVSWKPLSDTSGPNSSPSGDVLVDEWRAPSWSWASVDCDTLWIDSSADESGSMVKVNNVSVTGASADVTGALKHASLHLHGVLKAVEFRRRETSNIKPLQLGHLCIWGGSTRRTNCLLGRWRSRPDLA